MLIYDDHRNEAGVHHLQEVLVLQMLVCRVERHRRLPGGLERRVQAGQALVVAAREPDPYLPPGEIVQALQRQGCGTRDDDLAQLGRERLGEVDDRLSLRRDRESGSGNVAAPFDEAGQEMIACGRAKDDVYGTHASSAKLLVQELLELPECVVGDPALHASVEEVIGAAEGDEDPDGPTLGQTVEVGGPRFVEAKALGSFASPGQELGLSVSDRGGIERLLIVLVSLAAVRWAAGAHPQRNSEARVAATSLQLSTPGS